MTEEIINRAYRMLKAFFEGSRPTHTEIIAKAKLILDICSFDTSYSKNIIDLIVDRYEENLSIKSYEPDILVNIKNNNDWFYKMKNNPNQKNEFFERYKDYLRKDDFAESVIAGIEINCEKILSYCADPKNYSNTKERKKRGLVVGDVQSGKTANYLALMNMACDYKYDIILVLAGMTDSLRKQTQGRVDSGFVGAKSNTINSEDIEYVGVGKTYSKYFAIPLTNMEFDFNKFVQQSNNATKGDYNKPLVLVVKKNKKTLENVKSWLKPGKNNINFDNILIIDDEADNASLNTKDIDKDPSVINGLIRDIYNNFTIASYVGYTATPFANIFINPNSDEDNLDLFPEDFIILLNAPENYFGGNKVFNKINKKNSLPIREIEETEFNFLPVGHKKDDGYCDLPDSLKEAILCFLINNAIRTIRGAKEKHRTMMINISRFNLIQDKIKYKVSDYVKNLTNIIEQSSYMSVDMFIRNSEMNKIYNLYKDDRFYAEIKKSVEWKQIQNLLYEEIVQFSIVVSNNCNKGKERFDYEDYKDKGARVIVIGGFILSRGLTLEGLMISYYSRNGTAYDTMLQMCRWFGYRPKYEDLCRIYISAINIDCFNAVLDATNDLKDQFREMRARGKKPADFGLMVKESPDVLETTLLVTSRNKMRNSKEVIRQLNYSATPIDTSKLYKDKLSNSKNMVVLNEFIDHLKQDGILLEQLNNRYLFKDVNRKHIVKLIEKIKIPIENKKFDKDGLIDCIQNSDKFLKWDVAIATGDKNSKVWNFCNTELHLSQRSFEVRDEESYIRISGSNNRLVEPGIFNSGLSKEQLNCVKEKVKSRGSDQPIARDFLSVEGRKPIFVIYPIQLICEDIKKKTKVKQDLINEYSNDIILGFAIGFPENEGHTIIKYRVNKVKLEELTKNYEEDEDDEY